MFKNWTNRDWFWLSGVFIFIIMLLLANYYLDWETNLSIMASATSIALAVIAIFLSLKQDSDSKSTSESMRQDLTTQMGNIMNVLASRKGEIEEAATNVGQSVDTNTEIRNENYTYEQLVEHGEKIKRDTINQFKKEMNEKIVEEMLNLEKNQSKFRKQSKRYELQLEDEVLKILFNNPECTFMDIGRELNSKGIAVNISELENILKKHGRDA